MFLTAKHIFNTVVVPLGKWAFLAPLKTKEEYQGELETQLGSFGLNSVISFVSPKAQETITEFLGNHINKEETELFILHMLCNALGSIREVEGKSPVIVLFESIIKIVSKLDDSDESAKHAAKKLLTLFFPKGAEDLPVRGLIQKQVWEYAKQKLTEQIKELRSEFTEVQETFQRERSESSKFVVERSETVTLEICQRLMRGLVENRETIASEVGETAEENEWIEGTIQEFVETDSKRMTLFWTFVKKQIEPLVLHSLSSLTNGGENEWLEEIFSILDRAIKENEEEPYEILAKKVVEGLLSGVGISKKGDLLIPETFRRYVYSLVKGKGIEFVREMFESLSDILFANEKKESKLDKILGPREAKKIKRAFSSILPEMEEKFFLPQEAETVRGIFERYVQGIAVVGCTNLFGRIRKQENYKSRKDPSAPHFVSRKAIEILKLTSEHFRLLNKARKEEKKPYTHQLGYAACVRNFGRNLTEGVPKSPAALNAFGRIKGIQEEISSLKRRLNSYYLRLANRWLSNDQTALERQLKEKEAELAKVQEILNRERINNFFTPLTEDLLGILGITEKDLPASPSMQKTFWSFLTENILPKVLCDSFDKLFEPETIYPLLLSLVNMMEASIQEASEGIIEEMAEEGSDYEDDEVQDDLNEALGELIKHGVKMIPKTLSDTLLSVKQLRKLTASAIGKSFRKQLEGNTTAVQLAKKAILSALSPTKKKGDISSSPEEVKDELHEALVNSIVNQALAAFKAKAISPWDMLHEVVEAIVDAILGRMGLSLKHAIDQVCRYIFIVLLGGMVKPITAPIEYVVLKLIRWHVSRKVGLGMEILTMPIHKNLVCKIAENVVGTLKD